MADLDLSKYKEEGINIITSSNIVAWDQLFEWYATTRERTYYVPKGFGFVVVVRYVGDISSDVLCGRAIFAPAGMSLSWPVGIDVRHTSESIEVMTARYNSDKRRWYAVRL